MYENIAKKIEFQKILDKKFTRILQASAHVSMTFKEVNFKKKEKKKKSFSSVTLFRY